MDLQPRIKSLIGSCKFVDCKGAEAGANIRARTIITRLSELYLRRPAMLEELAKLEQKLNK